MKNTKIKTGEWEPKANIQGQRWSNGMAIMCNEQRHMVLPQPTRTHNHMHWTIWVLDIQYMTDTCEDNEDAAQMSNEVYGMP